MGERFDSSWRLATSTWVTTCDHRHARGRLMDILTTLIGLAETLRREKVGGYDLEPIPNQLDDEIRALTGLFLAGTDIERQLIISTFDEKHSMTLILFS